MALPERHRDPDPPLAQSAECANSISSMQMKSTAHRHALPVAADDCAAMSGNLRQSTRCSTGALVPLPTRLSASPSLFMLIGRPLSPPIFAPISTDGRSLEPRVIEWRATSIRTRAWQPRVPHRRKLPNTSGLGWGTHRVGYRRGRGVRGGKPGPVVALRAAYGPRCR